MSFSTAEEAAELGAQQVKAVAEKGFRVEMVLGNLGGNSSLPVGQPIKMTGWQ